MKLSCLHWWKSWRTGRMHKRHQRRLLWTSRWS
ncbi:hypothetical protein F441_21660 [Phytophthora nicotianae CJ01A1]|uniref:Uncharacterized protein n=4 Tax=Phytophthora nicotianae TaxID=4792 RepID=V9DYW9_PHYNI|nr:hypothetical protein F443_21773 [Phytophthora nicotianae P1569]ETM31534.1 hypothetical protein L914_20915 [Phytophthora nicotianae]ETP01036.1 hypothetical protein F441_21660 [Phytophthora nicotianae CJ01A1]ETP29179.1 hypothetical protein F442_21638 [Phytophthora nicotianae P10297]